mgnify:FL=1
MSVLSNLQIEELLAKGKLIKNSDPRYIGAACYELTAGRTYFDLTENNLRVDLDLGEAIIIKPWHRVVILTKEELDIPTNILARIISKGSFFSVGLSAVCTQADPGFKGHLGIVTQNFSDKYIKIEQDKSIAKIDFTLLSSHTTKPYDGQHGFKSNIWPIDTTLQKDYRDITPNPRIDTELNEAYKVLPKDISQVLMSLIGKQRVTSIALCIIIFVNTAILALSLSPLKPFDTLTAIIINLISQIIITAFTFTWNRKK